MLKGTDNGSLHEKVLRNPFARVMILAMTALFWTFMIVGALFVGKGLYMVITGREQIEKNRAILYNRPLAIVLWVAAVAWVLWETMKLGPADFGDFKGILFILFAGLGLSSIWMLKDYLVVRAMGLLALMAVWWVLKATFLEPTWTRLLLVIPSYAAIIAAMWFTVAPWRAKDLFDWLVGSPRRAVWIGWAVIAYGAALLLSGVALCLK
jgi:hypothetical protein